MARRTLEFSESGDPIKNWVADMHELAGPPHKPVGELEAMLAAAFAETQAATHIITGSLKASGKTNSEFDGDEWTGEIIYGGALWKAAVPGPPNDPVDYAIYEMARGGDHDFYGPLVAYEGKVEQILTEYFEKAAK